MTSVGASAGPTSAIVTGSPRASIWRASMSRDSSQPPTNSAARRSPSAEEVSNAIEPLCQRDFVHRRAIVGAALNAARKTARAAQLDEPATSRNASARSLSRSARS